VARRERKQGGLQLFIPPELPEIKFKLGTREIIAKSEQGRIIDQVRHNTFHINPKIWFGIHLLSIYVSMRPIEMMRLKEKDINVNGFFVLSPEDTKEGKLKQVPMLPEDIAFFESLPKGDPEQPFFRWDSYYSGAKAGEKFGIGLLRRHWHIARKELGIKPVDLYGGTRHTTVTALAQGGHTKYQIKEYATGHTTNKAFDRYMCVDAQLSLDIYREAAQSQPPLEVEPEPVKKTNILQFKRR
jgi:integrase